MDPETLAQAARILAEVKERGDAGLRRISEKLGDLEPDETLRYSRRALEAAWNELGAEIRGVLDRTADRIETFAEAQRAGLEPVRIVVPGGWAGLRYQPVSVAGCYAPGGRYPLPSSVLMTAVTAKVAGVNTVWVASPKPATATLAAAYRAGADGLLALGGAQAIAAMAYGTESVPPVDCIVGPGNRWVTAAKQLVSGRVAIDMLAGPSELVVIADESANPRWVAADLLSQAEHDDDAIVFLLTTSESVARAVDEELQEQLRTLPTAETALRALNQSQCILAESPEDLVVEANRIAPEHLALQVRDPNRYTQNLVHYGALFVGSIAAEALGDYGIGPNHVLPTGGTARTQGALSVSTFLRTQTWTELDRANPIVVSDAVKLARVEGLEAHARSAELRLP